MVKEDNKRPDGKTLIPWHQGRSLAWDVTCVDTFTESHISQTSVAASAAANKAERLKREKYFSLGPNYHFVPFGVETLGSWGDDVKDLPAQIGKRIAERTGEPRSLEFLRQRIGIEIQRGNAISVAGTLPQSVGLDSIFDLLVIAWCFDY